VRRLILALALVLALGPPLQAQIQTPFPKTISVIDSGTACSLVGTCASWPVTTYPTLLMQIVGTWTGTITFEATGDGQTWFAILVVNQATGSAVSTTTANGQFAVANTGIVAFRARATGAITGGANLSLTRGVSTLARAAIGAGSFPLLAPNGTAAAPSFSFASATGDGFYHPASNHLSVMMAGYSTVAPIMDITTTGIRFAGTSNSFGFTAGADATAAVDTALSRGGIGEFTITSVLFAALGTPANGSLTFCSDCLAASNPCTGASTGTFAYRMNGAWKCF
jgi:hypothetical protein